MLVRGIVDSIFDNQVKVRIPTFDKVYEATLGINNNDLYNASICLPPMYSIDMKNGDLVYILFENNDIRKPIIIGFIYNEKNSYCNVNLIDLDVSDSVIFSDDVNIGEVTKENIAKLSDIDVNIQEFLNIKKEDIYNINNNIIIINNKIKQLNNDIINYNSKINNINNNIININKIIGKNDDTTMDSTLFGQLNFVKNYLNETLDKIGNIDMSNSILDILNDYSNRINILEDSIHNGKTFNTPQQTIEEINVDGYSTLYECIMYDSTCYKGTGRMTPVGVLWHDTASNNTQIRRYVQPSDSDPNYDKLMNLIGKNQYGNDWNHIYHEAGVNAWIGTLADGSVATVQALPWDFRPWGCGSGDNGSCNSGWIQFEICQDAKDNSTYFNSIYNEALKLTAYLCKKFNIDPMGTVNLNGVTVPTILCHWDSHKLGLGSGHYDVYDWFPLFGKCKDLTMKDVRNDVVNLLNN